MDTAGLTATRFAQQPLHQPMYSFRHVPTAARDLRGSSLHRIENRQHFLTSMAELLLLCKEAMRRRRTAESGGGSKPLSLEYLADRLDVDDPLFGYLVRTSENVDGLQENWKRGMLQGFITVTTFTNWQRTFCWDSSNPAAFEADNDEMQAARLSGDRKWDESNELARGMQKTVRAGDIWAEGVVWPRIAEISLLGALGCGRALVALVIEELERMKATGRAHYDYVVLQATDNSISFYESMGFVRVGAVMEDEVQCNKNKKDADSYSEDNSSSSSDVEAEPVPEDSPEKADTMASPEHVVTSDITTYKISKAGSTVTEVARRLRVDVWDIVFLNARIYPELAPSSRLLGGTMLYVPKNTPSEAPASGSMRTTRTTQADTPQFYFAKENDTPRTIAKKFKISCLDLVAANKSRLAGLVSSSRLKEGTRVKVSHLDVPDTAHKPYAHWSFPDDQFEEGEPSYMMALKLNRRRGNSGRSDRPVLSSLAVPVTEYEPPSLLLPPSPPPLARPVVATAAALPPTTTKKVAASSYKKRKLCDYLHHPHAPERPKKPLGPYMLFVAEQREVQRRQLLGMTIGDVSRFLSSQWRELPEDSKQKYHQLSEQACKTYKAKRAVYESELESFLAQHPVPEQKLEQKQQEGAAAAGQVAVVAPAVSDIKNELYNKVVKLKPDACTEGAEYDYWYVLTYIPDLKWCHLAPLEKVGIFGPEKPKVAGRPKWMLVDESLGKEVDISSRFCIPIKARSMKRCLDADKEEWDIIDDGTDPTERRRSFSRSTTLEDEDSDRNQCLVRQSRPGSLVKPSVTRKRVSSGAMPPLIATYPGSSDFITVKLKGQRLYDSSFDNVLQKPRGRPRGSKNRPKVDGSPKGSPLQPNGQRSPHSSMDSFTRLDDDHATQPTSASAKRRGRPPGTKKLSLPLDTPASPTKMRGQLPCSGRKDRNDPLPTTPVDRKKIGLPRKSDQRNDSLPETTASLANSRPRRAAAPTYLGQNSAEMNRTDLPVEMPESSDDCKEPSRKKRKLSSQSEVVSSRPRRSAAPLFLGEAPELVISDAEKMPYNPQRASAQAYSSLAETSEGTPAKAWPSAGEIMCTSTKNLLPVKHPAQPVEPSRPASKRWHPVRETRNGKSTPMARRHESVDSSESSVSAPPSQRVTRSYPTRQTDMGEPVSESSDKNGRPKRKAAPTLSLLDETPRKRRSLRP